MKNVNVRKLVETYSDMIMRIAYQNCFNKSDSEDIVQEVFIKLMKNANKLKDDEQYIKAWLIRVTINESKDYNKNGWYKKVQSDSQLTEEYEFEPDEVQLLDSLAKLKPIYRNIIHLYYYEGYKIKEISQILKMKENTVSSNLTRARIELKSILEEGGENYGL